ncbi:uncharacterized protein LOC129328787 [Eublepharis macularius]|uniref:Uncharacterized protein LOC129328787 n=1 Tax=Eublepharis macularius TaxID=481883 RepID=A0AA97KXP0_EUBMA|nr:uncharacterized protein LOC129328787 [Eublepharis macularius]
MLSGHKKRAQKRVSVGPTTMEAAKSSPRLQDPRQSPVEVSEESLHREQPPLDPRIQSSVTEAILHLLREVSKDTKQLRAGQVSLRSEMALLRASISQIHERLDGVESRFSSLEDRACETQQTASIMLASQSDPRALPGASTSSFSSHQIISDASQTAVSPSSSAEHAAVASIEPAAPSASEPFRAVPSILVYVETEEKALQVLADAWSQERTSESETAHAQAGHQENTFSSAPPPIAPEYKPEPQPLTSTEEKALETFADVLSQDRISEGKSAHTEAEEFDPKEDIFSGSSPQKNKPDPQPLMNSLPETSQLRQPTTSDVVRKEAPPTAIQFSRRLSSNKRSSSTALACGTTSAGSRSHLVSPPPTKVMPPIKRQRTSIAWQYFTRKSKYIATCKDCGVDVRIGKRGGCGILGTAPLLSHLKRIHHIVQKKKAPSVLPEAMSKVHSTERPSTTERPSRISSPALSCGTTSVKAVCHLASSPPTKMMPPTKCQQTSTAKRRRTSIAWHYFAEKSKYIATCNICGVDVKIGRKGGCGILGTAALLSHLKRIHPNFKRAARASKMAAATTGQTRGHCHL